MKNVFKTLAILVVTVAITSCTTNESIEQQESQTTLLKSYTLKKDTNGSYSLDYSLNNDVKSDFNKNYDKNINEIYLYSSADVSQSRVSEELTFNGDKLTISFVNANNDKKVNIAIEDDTTFLQESKSLQSYEIVSNEDKTYTLNFSVKNNVTASFVYNELSATYEIHLDKGKSNTTNFARTFVKTAGEDLKIGFVNHISSTTNTALARVEQPYKPRMIIQEE